MKRARQRNKLKRKVVSGKKHVAAASQLPNARKVAEHLVPDDQQILLDSVNAMKDTVNIMNDSEVDKMSSEEILKTLNSDTTKNWATYCNGQILHSRRLAKLFKIFGIHSIDIRIKEEGVKKGYLKESFIRKLALHKINMNAKVNRSE